MVLTNTSLSSLPSTWQGLTDRLAGVGDSTYIFFICDNDSSTGKPWCPDVRAAIPVVQKYFEKRPEEILVVSVGQLPEWRKADNPFRTKWDLRAVPTFVKYTRTADGIGQKQVVEDDVKNEGNLKALVQS
ncbi:hypothetical protein JX265_005679 [Neoarthrinium moseri]|uniref:Thioredoxin domain-containing protein n=1 Tax=Neoarthrinium moseri TaxID=1658444 RepID=A0A9P9WNH4_9PEZI|nr:uncharacterized protein JN550_008419 [Neoarthrinium moseri]KAI1848694.1 hypothetical protein JX266_005553 [Neoarthrinium moseri]KAI1865371.1 hypothetical protein JN550_008419 [Neoarthrinium moseri]KAI1871693.1 hypothetical protein JX265_005679 [Neoarthrinium moseri]